MDLSPHGSVYVGRTCLPDPVLHMPAHKNGLLQREKLPTRSEPMSDIPGNRPAAEPGRSPRLRIKSQRRSRRERCDPELSSSRRRRQSRLDGRYLHSRQCCSRPNGATNLATAPQKSSGLADAPMPRSKSRPGSWISPDIRRRTSLRTGQQSHCGKCSNSFGFASETARFFPSLNVAPSRRDRKSRL